MSVPPDPRTPYRRFATFFLVTGGVFLVLRLARATLAPDLLQGNPLPTALVLLAIGGGLAWTVRRWEVDASASSPREDAEATPEDEDAV